MRKEWQAMSMNHDFWLFREEERAYTDYRDLLSRSDAPVSINDEILRYCFDTLIWIPTFNPAKNERGNGLNWWGPTIIDQSGGNLFCRIFTSWARLFTSGPELLRLHGAFYWQWPYDVSEHLVNEEELYTMGHYTQLEVELPR